VGTAHQFFFRLAFVVPGVFDAEQLITTFAMTLTLSIFVPRPERALVNRERIGVLKMIDKSSMMLAQLGFSQNLRAEDLVVLHNLRRRDQRDRRFRLDHASRLDRLPLDSSIDSPVSTNRKSQRSDRPLSLPGSGRADIKLPLRSPQSPESPGIYFFRLPIGGGDGRSERSSVQDR
jgi:hypothetical protein